MSNQLTSISPTRLRAYETCPLQYKMRYIQKVPRVDSPSSLVGQAVHRALEVNFVQKRRVGHDLDLKEVVNVFEDVWDSRLPVGASESSLADEFSGAYSSGLEILRLYFQDVAPRIKPHLIEHRFRFDIPGVPVRVVGTVDLIDQDGVVIDHKTSFARYSESYPETDLQLRCYAIGYAMFRAGSRVRPGQLPAPFFIPEVRVDVLVRSQPPVIQQLRADYDRSDIDDFTDRAVSIIAGIEGEAYEAFWRLPGREPDSSVCKRCPYCDRCPESLQGASSLKDSS